MTLGKFLLAFTFLLLVWISCDVLDIKSDLEKQLSNIANERIVDSIRVRQYGFIAGTPAQTPLVGDTLLPVIRMKFISSPDGKGDLIETSLVNGVEAPKGIQWRLDPPYLRLYYLNPHTGVADIEIIYDKVELTDNKFHLNVMKISLLNMEPSMDHYLR